MASASIAIKRFLTTGGVEDVAQALDTTVVSLRSAPLDFGEKLLKKSIRRFYTEITSRADLGNLYIVLYGNNGNHEAWTKLLELQPSVSGEPVELRTAFYRYFRIDVEDRGAKARWALYGFEAYGVIGGHRF